MKLKLPHISFERILFVVFLLATIACGAWIYSLFSSSLQVKTYENKNTLNLDNKTYQSILEFQKTDISITSNGNIGRYNPFDPF